MSPAKRRKGTDEPVGPFGPPTPSEVDVEGATPMAVARDEDQTHGESFVPTTASKDAFDPELARRYAITKQPARKEPSDPRAKPRDERHAEYRGPNAQGWIELEDDDEPRD